MVCKKEAKNKTDNKNNPLMVSQNIVRVEKAECKGRELEMESPWHGVQHLTLKKTIAHVVLNVYEALLIYLV